MMRSSDSDRLGPAEKSAPRSVARKWALNGRPSEALLLYAWHGARKDLGFLGAFRVFARAGLQLWLMKRK